MSKLYAVKKGRNPGIYETWNECEQNVKGFPGAMYKSFKTRKEAVEWVNPTSGTVKAKALEGLGSSKEKAPKAFVEDTNTLVVYTDGACPNNGKHGARGGIGVWFGPDDPRNISEPLEFTQGYKPTNNRAEMTAMLRALEIVEKGLIYTDSQYTMKGLTIWTASWKKKGWKQANGKPVLNQDLWQRLDLAYDSKRHTIKYSPGHSGILGNEMADRLAVAGAEKMDYLARNPHS